MKACYSRLNINSAFESFSSFVEDSQTKHLTPLIGSESVDYMQTWYDTYDPENLTQEDVTNQLLLFQIQRCLTFYTLLDSTPTLLLEMGDNGLVEKSSDNTVAARQWPVDRLLDYLSDNADAFAENLLNFLEINKLNYSFWNESLERQEARKMFVSSGSEVTKLIKLSEPRKMYLNMTQSLKRYEDLTIREMIGEPLFNEIKGQLEEDSLSVDNETLLIYIKPVLIYSAFVDTISDMSVAVGNNGLRVINNQDRISARNDSNAVQMQGIMTKYRGYAATYEGLLRNFLNDNFQTYPLFVPPVLSTDAGNRPKFPENINRKSFRL